MLLERNKLTPVPPQSQPNYLEQTKQIPSDQLENIEESKEIDEAEQKAKEKEIILKYKAKLAAKYQKSGNNFITSEMQVTKPDQVDAIIDFDQELDLPEENEKPL